MGDLIWYFYHRQNVKRSKKWSFAYVGPYRVTKKLSDLTYQIQRIPHGRAFVTHIDKLKRCADQTSDSAPLTNHAVLNIYFRNSDEEMGRSKRTYKCKKCKETFTRSTDVRRHDESAHLKLRWQCTECPVLIGSQSNISRHYHRWHPESE